MADLETSNLIEWAAIEAQYRVLQNGDLVAANVLNWLEQWSDLEKSVLETWTLLKRPAYRDTLDQAAVQAYEAFTQQMFSTHKALTGGLTRKFLAVPGFQPAPSQVQMHRRMGNEADLFRAENGPIQAEIITLVQAYGKMPREAGPDADYDALWLGEREAVNALTLRLLALRRQLARNAGLPDYRAYRWRELNRLDYSPEQCEAFHDLVASEIVPSVRGCAGRFPQAQTPPVSDPARLEVGVAELLTRVDPEIGALFGRLRGDYLDLGPRPGKAGGDEEWFFPQAGLPYLHVNSDDPFALIHESGHGFHDFHSLKHQGLFWNMSGPEEFQELAALGLQTLAYPYLARENGGFYSAEEARNARDGNVLFCLRCLPSFARDDAFQHWLYADAPEDVQGSDLDAKWLELTVRFLPDEDWTGREAEAMTGWQRWNWSLVGQPFYMASYLFAVLGAWQVWRNALSDQAEAVQALKAALALGNTRPLPELYEAAGARLPFDAGDVRGIVQFVVSRLESRSA